jgi:hypothetical protein
VYEPGFHSGEHGRTVTVRDGEVSVSVGPATSRDGVAGAWILDVPDADAAVEWAQKIPTASYHKVEVRPVVEYAG